MSTKLLVLGIDAANPDLLRRWADQGKLPALQAVMGRGVSGLVNGVPGFFIGSTWPSFYTGLNPARHGFYRIEQLRSGSYDSFRPLDTAAGVGGTPFWRLASDAGQRVAVLDVPLSRTEPDLNGVQIVEWGGHDSVFGFHTAPRALADAVQSSVGPYPMPSSCDAHRTSADDFEHFVAGLELAVAKKCRLTLDLMQHEQWDLFAQVFTEAHCAGHQCWHIHDAAHPSHDPALLDAVGDPLERVYRAIDDAIGRILEQAGDVPVLVVSAHGMLYSRGANFLLPEMLYRLGATARPPQRRAPRGAKHGPLTAAALGVWQRLPPWAKGALRPVRAQMPPGTTFALRAPRLQADLGNSRCFPLSNGTPVSGIRLNLVGREPQGQLQPGAEADTFCDQLADDLRALVDERTGRPVVASVQRTDQLHRGDRQDALPDLLVEWDSSVATGSVRHAGGRGATIRVHSDKTGWIEGSNRQGRTGEHVPTGMFVYAGPESAAGARVEPVSVMDFHPTLCRLLDLPTPDVDGRAIESIVGRAG